MALFGEKKLASQRGDWERKIRLAEALQPTATKSKPTNLAVDVFRTLIEEGGMLISHPFGYVAYKGLGQIPLVPDRLAARIASRLPGGFEAPIDETTLILMKRAAASRGVEARQLENAVVGYAGHAAAQVAEARATISPRAIEISRLRLRKFRLNPTFVQQREHAARAIETAERVRTQRFEAVRSLTTFKHAPAARFKVAEPKIKRFLERRRQL
ncbi:hypothetical protein H0O03_02790 [Candidatus Micrarchaeota archaeon]|nr:hypothetical protein [Candidatus Micrarchaeota archaeon]